MVIACCGALVQDCFLHTRLATPGTLSTIDELRHRPGGSVSNVGTALEKLGVTVEAVGCVGRDPAGGWLIEELSRAGIDTAGIRVVQGSSGASMIFVTPDGERTIYYHPGANEQFDGDQVMPSTRWQVCHVGYPTLLRRCQGETLARLFRRLQQMGIVTALDTAWSTSPALLAELEPAFAWTDIFTPSLGEAAQLTGLDTGGEPVRAAARAAAFFLAKGVKVVAITLGAGGSYLATAADGDPSWSRSRPRATMLPGPGLAIHAPAFETRGALNSTAAGDTFAAGLMAALANGAAPETALRVANLAAALQIEGSDLPVYRDIVVLSGERRPLATA